METAVSNASRRRPTYCRTYWRECQQIQEDWKMPIARMGVGHPHRLALIVSKAEWLCDTRHSGHLKMIHVCEFQADLPMNLRYDVQPAPRTRLRFNQARLNHSLFLRSLVASPFCEDCPQEPETPEHVLMWCPRYMVERASLWNMLEFLGVEVRLDVILGNATSVQATIRRAVLQLTSRFIVKVHRRRAC